MGTLEQELQKIHDAELGVSITWLCDGGVDLRLVHKSGVVAAEGNVAEIANILPWLESAFNKHFPEANAGPLRKPPGSTQGAVRARLGGRVVRAERRTQQRLKMNPEPGFKCPKCTKPMEVLKPGAS
jgi:hypothetical protein